MLKAREAISSTWSSADAPDDVDAALQWLEADRAKSGAAKADKVASRIAREGLVAVALLSDGVGGGASAPAQGAIVELNCETDFVGRTPIFAQLTADVAHSAALFPSLADIKSAGAMTDIPIEALLEFPLLRAPVAGSVEADAAPADPSKPQTVQGALVDAVARLGERVRLARASTITLPAQGPGPRIGHFAGAYAHGAAATPAGSGARAGSGSAHAGRVASLVLASLNSATVEPVVQRALARSLARQSAGFPTKSIEGTDETALLAQPFAMAVPAAGIEGEGTVQQSLERWGQKQAAAVAVVELRRWELGETDSDEPPLES